MNTPPAQITLQQWDQRYAELCAGGLREAAYGGPLGRHLQDGDFRLTKLRYDNSAASLRLWNFLLSEEDRLQQARQQGKKIIGTMKDLGTVPVLAYALPDVVAFYPDGAWWIPCVMELSSGDLGVADRLGIDDSFCPVRAMLGAFATLAHFPAPDLLICSAGATCDDFSAIAQRLNGMGWPILWWEIPARLRPETGEVAVTLPGGFSAPASQVHLVKSELARIARHLEELCGTALDERRLKAGIAAANRVRRLLNQLLHVTFTAERCPLPALELMIAQMLAIHYCSDREETIAVLSDLLAEATTRRDRNVGFHKPDAARIFWINPVADLRAMNLLEECGGRLCGSDFMFCHALDLIPEDLDPMDALARMALADPMVGSSADRARRICRDAAAYGAEAIVISRIPGASHCALEGEIFREIMDNELGLPTVEIEIPPVSDALLPALRTRLEALVETVLQRRDR